ncbi:MAG: DnaB-like helicase C-terminal domain-containing protein [Fusobacteriaceae bacterium]
MGFNISSNQEVIKKMMENLTKHIPGISTGFENLDNSLNGGFHNGLYVIGGTSSLGKTSLMTQIACNIASTEKKVRFYSLEMGTDELLGKLVTRHLDNAEFTTTKMKTDIFTTEEQNDCIERLDTLEVKTILENLEIIEVVGGCTIEEIKADLESVEGEKPFVIIDYLQIIKTEEKGDKRTQVDFIVSELKRMSRDLKTTIVVIASFGRSEYLKRADISSFKESGGIEYGCDCCLLLEYAFMKDSKFDIDNIKKAITTIQARNFRQIRVVVAKNRNGKQFDDNSTFDYRPDTNKFTELEDYIFDDDNLTTK